MLSNVWLFTTVWPPYKQTEKRKSHSYPAFTFAGGQTVGEAGRRSERSDRPSPA